MLECKDVRPLLAEYEAGTLPEEQAAQVAEHLLLCPICAAALEDLRRAGDRPVITAEAPSPAAPRSLGTQDPLAEQKAEDPVTEDAAPVEETVEQESVTVQTTEITPARKLRLRTKILLALSALLVVLVGVCVGILHSWEAFAIQDWAKSEDDRFVAVIYEGTESGEEGFHLQLWDKQDKQWYQKETFAQETYCQMLWSPDGKYLAVESKDADDFHKVQLVFMKAQKKGLISMYTRLKSQLNETFGYLGKVDLEDVPSCRILSWTADSSALLMDAQGEAAPVAWDFTLDTNSNDTVVHQTAETSGCLMYDVTTYDLDVVRGFGMISASRQETRNNVLLNRFNDYMMQPGASFAQKDRRAFFGADALLKLLQVVNANEKLHLYYDYSSATIDNGFSQGRPDLSALDRMENAEGVMLILARDRQGQGPAQEAYLILPYWTQPLD